MTLRTRNSTHLLLHPQSLGECEGTPNSNNNTNPHPREVGTTSNNNKDREWAGLVLGEVEGYPQVLDTTGTCPGEYPRTRE